jgi:hypothetical protein
MIKTVIWIWLTVAVLIQSAAPAAALVDDFSDGGWRQSNPRAPGTVTAAPGKLVLKDHPGGEVTWGTSMSKVFAGVDLAAMPYLVIKVNRLTGGYEAKLLGKGGWKQTSVCRGSGPGLAVIDIAKATGWKLGEGDVTVMLYTMGDGTEAEYGFVKFTDTLTAEEMQILKKKDDKAVASGVPVKAGLDALAARVGTKPLSVVRPEDGERTVYTDPVTARRVWRMTDDPGVERHIYYDILAWNANGSTMMWLSWRPAPAYWLMNADGANIRPLPDAADGGLVQGPHWSWTDPDTVYFARGEEKRTTVYALDVTNGEVSEVVSVPVPGRVGDRSFTEMPPPHPDGRHFLLRWGNMDQQKSMLVVVDAKTGKYRKIEPGMTVHRARFTKHPSTSIFVNSSEDPDKPGVRSPTSWMIAPDGTKWRLSPHGGHPDWTPDGQWLGVFYSNGIWLISHDGTIRKELVNTDANGHGGFSITSGLYHVADAPPRSGPFGDMVYVTEMATGRVTPIAFHGASYLPWSSGVPDPEATHPAPICSPDETKIVFDSDLMGQPDMWVAVWKRPGAPREVRLADGRLTWQPPERRREIASYTVYREQDQDWAPLRVGIEGTTAANMPGGGRLAVAAREWSGLESHLAVADSDILVFDRLAPDPVGGLKITKMDIDTVDIEWSASLEPALAHYNVYAADAPDTAPCRATLVGSPKVPRFLDWGLQPDTEYWYRVTAVDAQGNESLPSAAVAARTTGEAGPPFTIELEAETAECEPPVVVAEDDKGGTFVHVPHDDADESSVTEGHVRFRFRVPRDALYVFWARTRGPDKGSNLFLVSLDGSDDVNLSVPAPRGESAGRWLWHRFPGLGGLALDKGEHELLVKLSEGGTRLDKLVLSTEFGFEPTDGGIWMPPAASLERNDR